MENKTTNQMTKKKGMKMRNVSIAVKETNWRKGNWQRKIDDEIKKKRLHAVCMALLATHPHPTVMRQTNELAFCHAGHMCVADTDWGRLINQQQK